MGKRCKLYTNYTARQLAKICKMHGEHPELHNCPVGLVAFSCPFAIGCEQVTAADWEREFQEAGRA